MAYNNYHNNEERMDSETSYNEDDDFSTSKINPQGIISRSIFNCQEVLKTALLTKTPSETIVIYHLIINQLESQCKAANYIDDVYFQKVKDYIETPEVKAINNMTIRDTKISDFKYRELIDAVFKSTPLSGSLRL